MAEHAGKWQRTEIGHAPVRASGGPAPGKRTLAEQLPGTATGAPVQRVASGGGPRPMARGDAAGDAAAIHASAERGVATASSPLPHAETIQRLFGRHDISAIQAHTGADAAASARAMGAAAYATGNHVVLGNGADLHTTAHEAAHVVQQRRGIQLKARVGEPGDAGERHADAVADQVVRGESAEALLDDGLAEMTHPQPASSAVVQRMFDPENEGAEPARGERSNATAQPATVQIVVSYDAFAARNARPRSADDVERLLRAYCSATDVTSNGASVIYAVEAWENHAPEEADVVLERWVACRAALDAASESWEAADHAKRLLIAFLEEFFAHPRSIERSDDAPAPPAEEPDDRAGRQAETADDTGPGTGFKKRKRAPSGRRSRAKAIDDDEAEQPTPAPIGPTRKLPKNATTTSQSGDRARRTLLKSAEMEEVIAALGDEDHANQLLQAGMQPDAIKQWIASDLERLKLCFERRLGVTAIKHVFARAIERSTIEQLVPARWAPLLFEALLAAGMTRTEGVALESVTEQWKILVKRPAAEVLTLLRQVEGHGDVLERYGVEFLEGLDQLSGLTEVLAHLNGPGHINDDTREISGAHVQTHWASFMSMPPTKQGQWTVTYKFAQAGTVGSATLWRYHATCTHGTSLEELRYPPGGGFLKTVYPDTFTREYLLEILRSAIAQKEYRVGGGKSTFNAMGQRWTLTTSADGGVKRLW